MKARSLFASMIAVALSLGMSGCMHAPGKPGADSVAPRPDQIMDFATLYRSNCAGCHGTNGMRGAAISLANPVYLATAGYDNILQVTANGVHGTLMPGFGMKAGGSLTDAQLAVVVHGMVSEWGRQGGAGANPIPYASHTAGVAAQGQKAFGTFCASCHGADGAGVTEKGRSNSIVDPAYLALISDQGLRSVIIAGMPEEGMPDSRSDLTGPGAQAMSDQEVTDVVAWLGSMRSPTPGQVYPKTGK